MQVKALDHIEDVNQHAEPDGNGGFSVQTVITRLDAGQVVDIPEDQAKRLIARGLVSEDLDASLLPHLLTE